MTRVVLSFLISALCVGIGLASAEVQSQNFARAARLDKLKRSCDLIEAGSESSSCWIQMRMSAIEREARSVEKELPEH
ncbi:MAG: hypothetical protein ACI8X5_001463 [Planctomycetota bacterium]|jgi:hypothetical protein